MRILVADDDEVTRHQLSGYLTHLGHEAVEARDGLEAWSALQTPDAPPLVILDWMMPAPDGVEICRRLRQSHKRPYQYVIMVTARESMDDLVEGMDAGADDYLKKPCDMRELRARLRAGERVLALQDELRTQATTDELTGLLNRRGILERLGHEVMLTKREGRAFSVLIVDIDNFKAVNDTYGHTVGDEVLKHVASRMRGQLRPYDDLGRYGGEEFLVVVPACDEVGARAAAERLRADVCAHAASTSTGAIGVSVSIGVATGDGGRLDSEALINAADSAVYAAKRSGRNAVEVATISRAG